MIVNPCFLGPSDKAYTVVWTNDQIKVGDVVNVRWDFYRNVLLRLSDRKIFELSSGGQVTMLADMEHMAQLFETAEQIGYRLMKIPFPIDKAHGGMLLNNLKNAKNHLLGGSNA